MATNQNPGDNPTTTSGAPRRKGVSIAVWVVQVLLAAFMIFAAFGKLTQPSIDMYALIGFGDWFRYLTLVCELAGAIGLLLPRLCSLAAAGLTCVMIGATLTNLFLLPNAASAAIMTVVLGIIFALISWYRRSHTTALLAMVGARRPQSRTA